MASHRPYTILQAAMTGLARPRWIAPVVVLALAIRGAASGPQVIPANDPLQAPGTGMIVGQVLDATGPPFAKPSSE